MWCVYLKFRPFVLIQICLQQLLGHLNFSLEAIYVLIGLTRFGRVLVGSLSVKPNRAGLPFSSKHNGVPEFQPFKQTAICKLQVHKKKYVASVEDIFYITFYLSAACNGVKAYVIAEQLCVVSGRESVDPQSRRLSLCVLRIVILFVFGVVGLHKSVAHVAGMWPAQQTNSKNIIFAGQIFFWAHLWEQMDNQLPGQKLCQAPWFLHNLTQPLQEFKMGENRSTSNNLQCAESFWTEHSSLDGKKISGGRGTGNRFVFFCED